MPDKNNKIVIFLAFANDREDSMRYLRNLPDETRRLREALKPAEDAGLCEVLVRSNCAAEDIFKVFQDPQYRNRIAIFHYGGHANGYSLLLESADGHAVSADAGGFAAFLAQQQGMQLVFLNGCSTQEQTQGLLDANVPTIISTSRSINDKVATDFSHNFYQGLAGGASIHTAYKEAEASVQTSKGGKTRETFKEGGGDSENHPDTDRWPWDLHLCEGDSSADQWNLPQAVGDPLFGLPPLPQQDLPESPYRYLNWFTRKDAEVFFGRGHQIRELYERLTAPHSAPILLFYGQSGVGKSSVLDAGLIPRLERDYEVRYLRRTSDGLLSTLQQTFLIEPSSEVSQSQSSQDPGKPVVEFLDEVEEFYPLPNAGAPGIHEQLLRVLKTIFSEPKRYLEQTAEGMLHALRQPFSPPEKDTPIATAWRQQEEKTGKPLIVILDQVEELYTHPNAEVPDELKQFLLALETLFSDPNRRPKGRLVLGFRKEWLAELEAQMVQHKLPRTKVFLEPLDRRGVMEVVQGPAQSRRLQDRYRLTVDKELPEVIADDLLEDRDSAVAPTLQILLTKLWTKATENNADKPNFNQEQYQDLKRAGILMRDFLEQQMAKFRKLSPQEVDSGLLLDLLAAHTTALGTAGQCSLADLQQHYAHLGTELDGLLQQCQDLQLLTVAASASTQSNKTTRLAHDTLAPLIRESFDKSDKPGQRTRRILDNRSVEWAGDKVGMPLDEADLAVVEHGADGTRMFSATEKRLLEASRKARARLHRNRKRLKMGALAAVVVIVLAGGFGWKKSIEANKARKETYEAIVKFAFQSFYDGPKKTCNIANMPESFYLSKTSGYGLLCYVEKIVNLGDLQRMSKLKIFLSGPHHVKTTVRSQQESGEPDQLQSPDQEQNEEAGYSLEMYSNTSFGHYNPKFVNWAVANLIPSAEILAGTIETQIVYEKYLRDQVRIFYQVYRDLKVNTDELEILVQDYAHRIETWQGNDLEYDSTSPGAYIQDKFSLYAAIMLRQSLEADIVSDFSEHEPEWSIRWNIYYRYRMAGAFWLRREMDGSAKQFFSGVEKLLERFDPGFKQMLPDSRSPTTKVRDSLVGLWGSEDNAIELYDDHTYAYENGSQQGTWQLTDVNILNQDGQNYDLCTTSMRFFENNDPQMPLNEIIERNACGPLIEE